MVLLLLTSYRGIHWHVLFLKKSYSLDFGSYHQSYLNCPSIYHSLALNFIKLPLWYPHPSVFYPLFCRQLLIHKHGLLTLGGSKNIHGCYMVTNLQILVSELCLYKEKDDLHDDNKFSFTKKPKRCVFISDEDCCGNECWVHLFMDLVGVKCNKCHLHGTGNRKVSAASPVTWW
jgi:hypothetical protein